MSESVKWTNKALISWTSSFFAKKGIENPKLEAELLLSHASGISRLDLFMAYEDEPTEAQRVQFRDLVRRRAQGEPAAYLIGAKEFYSIGFNVGPGVLIPRPETEQLVLETIEYFKGRGWRTGSDGVKRRSLAIEERLARATGMAPSPSSASASAPDESGTLYLCDVGVGSGCISAALAGNIPSARVLALDVSPAALSIAADNLKRLKLDDRVELRESDLFSAVPDDLFENERFDAIVSNPPYVSEAEYAALEPTVRDYEPRVALVGGPSGAEIALELVRQAADRIKVGGRLALELSPTTVDIVAQALDSDPRWREVAVRKDFAGLQRFVIAFRQP